MKKVVSVSLGSSKRDHRVEHSFLGEKFIIERIGTDGDLNQMKDHIKTLDGKVDAFGLGGMDLYLCIGKRKYMLKDAEEVVRCAQKTPIVDGSGLKNCLEKKSLEILEHEWNLISSAKRVLLVSAMDRYGMAESLERMANEVVYGDVIFSLGLPVPLRSLKTLEKIAWAAMPVVRLLPFSYIYSSGNPKRNKGEKFWRYYQEADIICGDFHYINQYMPPELPEKTIITNTTTKEDVIELKKRGVNTLITTTPSFRGRSFGANVMEALLVALKGDDQALAQEEYESLLDQLDFVPNIIFSNGLYKIRRTI